MKVLHYFHTDKSVLISLTVISTMYGATIEPIRPITVAEAKPRKSSPREWINYSTCLEV
jgi:hypothetical protein